MQIRKAERKRQNLRIALCSPPGAGKTYTALRLAHGLGGPVGVIDTENGSAELYAGEANPDGGVFDFVTIDLAAEPGKFSVDNYVKALHAMHDAGVRTVIVDSGSHAWAGEGGVLEMVDDVARRSKTPNNKFVAWSEATPKHNEWIQALLTYPGHLIVTLRTKMEHVQEKDAQGRTTIRKVGLAPIQRDGLEYEFTIVAELDVDTHRLMVTKSRCSALADRSFVKAGADMAKVLTAWLDGGTPETAPTVEITPEHQKTAAEVKAERAAADAARKAAHHPSWTTGHKPFASDIAAMGLNVGIAMDAIGEGRGKRPSQMDNAERMDAIQWLRSNEGALLYDRLVSEREQA